MKVYLDELGIAGQIAETTPFIFGGLFTFKKEDEIEADWVNFLRENNITLTKKSKRFPDEIWIPFSDFLINGYFPITLYSFLTPKDNLLIKTKCKEYTELKSVRNKSTPEKANPADLMWNMTIMWLIGLSITKFIISGNNIPINEISIYVDRTSTNPQFKYYSELAIKKRLEYASIENTLKTSNVPLEIMLNFNNCCNYSKSDINIDWKMKGPIKELPGAVCTLLKKKLENLPEAKEAWKKLENHFIRKNSKLSSLSMDASQKFSEMLEHIDWSANIR